jgi:carboxypeptidase Taq
VTTTHETHETHETTAALDFTRSDARIGELLELGNEIADLSSLTALATWDQNTALPDGAGEVRGAQLATIEGTLHERWTSRRLGELLAELEKPVQASEFNDADRGLVRQMRRGHDHATKLPRGLVQEMARVGAASFEAWRRARQAADFSTFAPWLSQIITLQREVADRLGYKETRYDALLDEYEPGMTSSKLDKLFGPVREVSATLLRRIAASGHTVDAGCLEGKFAADSQIRLSERMLRAIGYDFGRGQVAISPHPFTTSFGSPYDVRLTVRTSETYLPTSLMAALHEGGHALYEQGMPPQFARTPLASGASLGAHESQSRLWENGIGRSEAFWRGHYATVREAYPQHFAKVDAATFARALNRVQPSLIRVEADEVTYNLHIIIRYELEKAIVEGDVAVESLPGMWNAKYREYLGIEPESHAEGILQDVHWSSGFGYFPTYTLGNLYAAQILGALRRAFPDFDGRLAAGDTSFVLGWLHEHMHAYGAAYEPEALIERVTGAKPDPKHFTRYLTTKFAAIYDLPEK